MHTRFAFALFTSTLTILSYTPSAVLADSVTVVTVAAPEPTGEPSYVDGGDFSSSILNSTNLFRYEHNASALAWNDSLQAYAQSWTDKCNFAHSAGPLGENLAEGYATVVAAVDAWGDERALFDFSAPDFGEATGHFTQLVWKASATVGCGRTFCSAGQGTVDDAWFLTCEYWPPGNVEGTFDANVQAQVNGGQGYVFQNGSHAGGGGGGGSAGDEDSQGQSEATRTVSGSPVLALVLALTMAFWLC